MKNKGIRMPYCAGCRPRDKKCAFLKKTCERLLSGSMKYCYQCSDFPCASLEHIGKRYRAHFRMSIIENLECIGENGIRQFLQEQDKKWQCPECEGVIYCHNGVCFDGGLNRLKNKAKLYRWED